MLPYQNFYPQMNNNYQMPMQNPYMDRMAQLQQYQQSLQQPVVPTQMSGTNQQMNVIGKIVDSIDVVKATDVPMDGSMYYFPKADGTEIFSKQWLSNGQTRILTFKPDLETEPNNVSNTDEKLNIRLVRSDSPMLMRSDGSYTVGMCDRTTQTIYISDLLQGKFLRKVLIHEITHSAMFSYGIDMSVEQEEMFCDLLATYGDEIIGIVDNVFRVLSEVA